MGVGISVLQKSQQVQLIYEGWRAILAFSHGGDAPNSPA